MRIVWLLFALVLVTAGCTTWPYTQMTPEQITAVSKIKDASAICFRAVYAGAIITTVSVSADKAVPSGTTIKESCETVFTSATNTEERAREATRAGHAQGVAEGRAEGVAEAEALERAIAERVKAAVEAEAKRPRSTPKESARERDLFAPQ